MVIMLGTLEEEIIWFVNCLVYVLNLFLVNKSKRLHNAVTS